jgi:excinuclease ABC subunit C
MKKPKIKLDNISDNPGVYLMKDKTGRIIYIGKATFLKERLRSYFYNNLPIRTEKQMEEVEDIEVIETDTAMEALFLEGALIRKNLPKYNIKEKDDKSYIYVCFTKEDYPAVSVVRETDLHLFKKNSMAVYGPYTSSKSITDAIEFIRKIIPFRTCNRMPQKRCLYGYLGLCQAPCETHISKSEYRKDIRKVRDFFEGKKEKVISALKDNLHKASDKQQYEKAAQIRDKIFALERLKKTFTLSRDDPSSVFRRIEGYDISNIMGRYAVGSMVVFLNGMSEKSEYRKFKIKNTRKPNDIAMMGEVIRRRFKNDWPKPDLILIDGGRGQVNAALLELKRLGLSIPVVGIAKGKDRKKDELVTSQTIPRSEIILLKMVRDEAHRFARGYYEKLHRREYRNN